MIKKYCYEKKTSYANNHGEILQLSFGDAITDTLF